ncbi:ABC transporter permease [Kaistia geumhonensis]|uniref:Simple sugar transport system permease protein n=1 Tax=Kaistia geumhonensis TaxID=410839 RepID=A0ABU0M4K2_9HYPH|nr:ABC transporter permease [Kaistia geumhonensis]MCX5478889.1 ABC transporter permease [Kaistia geumhonensis]MDQ0515892.1 simple sugar transport system permease protein [Kaistia geumhonensis]
MTDLPAGSGAPPRSTPFELARRYALFVLLGAMLVGFWLAQPAFINSANLFSILQAVSVVAILGVGVSITMSAGGFDLSVGSVAASSVMAASYLMVVLQFDAATTMLLVLLMGALIGLANGLLIVKVGVPDLLATLSSMFLLAGLQLIPTGGRSITAGMMLPDGSTAKGAYDPAFLILGRSRLFDIVPLPVVVMAAVAVIAWFLMERTRFGRVFYAIGGNETAAHLSGAPTKAYRLWAYVISGTLASLGGLIVASRVGRGDVSAGASLLLDAVAASLIGFAVLDKRRPHVLGTVLGAIFVGVLLNGLTMLNAPYYTQDFVKGAVLVGALALTFGLGKRRR